MKKTLLLFIVLLSVFLLSACKKNNIYKVGATPTPHAEILRFVQPLMEEEGYLFEIVEYTDYVLPNRDLDSGELIANYFQHIPYLDAQVTDFDYDFTNIGGVHVEPIGLYSKTYNEIDDFPNELSIIISSSKTDRPRLLAVLEENNLIELNSGVNDTDIINISVGALSSLFASNYVISFIEVDPSLLYTNYDNESGDAVLINGNYALENGLNPTNDALLLEGSASLYVNILVANTSDVDHPFIIALLKILQSETVKTYIEETYQGSVIPVN